MALISDSLSYVTEHYGGHPCEVVRNQALSGQFYIELLRIETNPGMPGRLLNLRMRFAAGILDQIFERVWTYTHGRSMPQTLSLAGADEKHLWFHVRFENENQMLVAAWHWQMCSDGRLCLHLERVFHLGHIHRDPLDLYRDHLVSLEHALLKCGHQPLALEIDRNRFHLCLNIHDWMMKLIVAADSRPAPLVDWGRTTAQMDDDCFLIEYEAGDVSSALDVSLAQGNNILSSCDAEPDVILLCKAENSSQVSSSEIKLSTLSEDAKRQKYMIPSLIRLFDAVVSEQKMTESCIAQVLKEGEEQLPKEVFTALLFMIQLWVPEFMGMLKLSVLPLASSEHAPAIVLNLLADIYRREQNDTLLVTLLQRQLNYSTFCPHRLIRLGLETVEIFSGSLMMYSLAVRRLDAMKSLVLQHGSIRELIAFALAYHHAQYSGMAIQCLKQWMKQATRGVDIAAFGYQLAKVMLEHNEPLQRIIDVCTRVLEAEPTHSATLEILSQCLEDSDRPEEAAENWHHCFDCLMQAWELARVRYRALPTPENGHVLAENHKRAVRTAHTLERLLTGLEHAPQRCLIYREHLRLEPNATHVLAHYLKDLENMHCFYEMAQCCEDFLRINSPHISTNDEISIRLTLHNIYDRELYREAEAMEHLTRLRQIGALDPRVISAEIERCRRRGQKSEQIPLMTALIDALPAAECVEPTLELVRLYESVQTDVGIIAEVLRKTNARYPNQAPILLELRSYLRKMGQSFELASVLEKLAKVTTDLQTRRSILLEASEIQEKLGSHKLAQSLYHEAQLCSPINPIAKTEIPQSLRLGYDEGNAEFLKAAPISRLASVVLTSRSVSAVHDLPETPIQLIHTTPGLGGTQAEFDKVFQSSGIVSDWVAVSSSSLSVLALDAEEDENKNLKSVHDVGRVVEDDSLSDSQQPVEEQIMAARLKGNTQSLLDKLLRVIDSMPESEHPPRMLQEIGCIYLYDRREIETAKIYLERACRLSEEVAAGEQTLNALEEIYYSLKCYRELADVYQKKCEILTIAEEKRKYEIRLAQIRYEHLHETGLAVETLNRMLEHYPVNESALQLLAQIYLETQQIELALETFERISGLLKPHSKAMSQHLLRLSGIYIEHERREDAKRTLRCMLNQRDYVDKLAVLEQYKGMCRSHDEWHELLELLREELALHLKLEPSQVCIDEMVRAQKRISDSGHAAHTLREYADVLFYKVKDIDLASDIYIYLARLNPDDVYPVNILFEMLEQYPDAHHIIGKLIALMRPDDDILSSTDRGVDDFDISIFHRALEHLHETRETSDDISWHAKLEELTNQIAQTRYAKNYAPLLKALNKEKSADSHLDNISDDNSSYRQST